MSLNKLGRYDLVRVLGRGAMGVVYEARDPTLDRRVAIKTVIVEDLTQETAEEYEARFLTEARSAARLQHPNIVSVYDSDRDLDIAYLVMEYIEGEDLKQHLDKGIRYSLEQSLKMIGDLLSALDYAHHHGIVHRDIKPANLLIEQGGRVKLTDFGVARIQNSGEPTRTQGNMVGTLRYMSPEQVQGQKCDARADLFSVGVLLYQLLTDKRPFDGDNDFSVMRQIIGHTPAPPSSFNPGLPSALDAVVARALAKDRDQRFATARDFAVALQSAIRCADDLSVVPPADPLRKPDRVRTVPRGQLSMPGFASGGANVAQEVELVYWKDIKESIDPEELQGFLDKFPEGIYADLARRRLRKLSAGSSPDQTILSGATLPGRNQDLQATARRDPTAPPDAAPLTAGAALRPSDTPTAPVVELAFLDTAPIARDAEPASAPDLLAGSVLEEPVRKVVQPPLVALRAGLGAVAVIVVGIAVYWIMGGSGTGMIFAAAAPNASSAAPAAAPAPEIRPVPPVALASANPAVAPASSAPQLVVNPHPDMLNRAPAAPTSATPPAAGGVQRQGATAARPKPVEPAPPPVAVARQVPPPAPSPAREEPKPATTPQVAAVAPSPVDSCKDKFFIMKELCLTEQCNKPGTHNHPLCVKHRADVELRGDTKAR